MKRFPSPSRFSGFTLVELLVVIAIIAILAALVLSAAGFVQKKGARSRAEAEIAAMGAALESYKVDNGDYPINTNANYNNPTNNSNMVVALMPIINGVNLSTNGSTKVYFEFKAKFLTNGSFLDPFGNPYGYNYTNGSSNNGTNNYDLWSTVGGSGTATNTWIKNW